MTEKAIPGRVNIAREERLEFSLERKRKTDGKQESTESINRSARALALVASYDTRQAVGVEEGR